MYKGNARHVAAHQILVVHRVGHSRVCVAIHRQPHRAARIVHHRVCSDTDGIAHRHLNRLVDYGVTLSKPLASTLDVSHVVAQHAYAKGETERSEEQSHTVAWVLAYHTSTQDRRLLRIHRLGTRLTCFYLNSRPAEIERAFAKQPNAYNISFP